MDAFVSARQHREERSHPIHDFPHVPFESTASLRFPAARLFPSSPSTRAISHHGHRSSIVPLSWMVPTQTPFSKWLWLATTPKAAGRSGCHLHFSMRMQHATTSANSMMPSAPISKRAFVKKCYVTCPDCNSKLKTPGNGASGIPGNCI